MTTVRRPQKSDEADIHSVPVARNYVRRIRAFTIGIGFGLVPFLVDNPLPGFQPLIHIFPGDLRPLLLVITPLLMGSIAVVVDFYWDKKFSEKQLSQWFSIAWRSFIAGAALLVILYTYFVVRTPEGPQELYTIGWYKSKDCTCAQRDDECLEGLSYDPEICWGSLQINTVKLVFQIAYWAVNFGFGALIGLLMLKKRSVQVPSPNKSRPRPPRKRKPAKKQAAQQPTDESAKPGSTIPENKSP